MVATVDVPAGRPGETVDYVGVFKRISWGAIIAGALIALAVHAMLTLLGAGIGLGLAYPTQSPTSPEAVGIGAAIWGIIATIIALFIGGWVAAHLAGAVRQMDGALHGLVAWSLATVITLAALSGTMAMLGGAALTNLDQRDGLAMDTRGGDRAQQQRPGAQERDAGTDQTIKAERAATAASGTALATFVILIVGAAAGLIGGYVGSNTDYDNWPGSRTDRTDRVVDRTDRTDRPTTV